MENISINNPEPAPCHVGIIGGGVAGSTIALRLAELGIKVTLLEKSASLISGPPICHLHAGGNLYREISQQQCITLLRQSIDTLKYYQQSINFRPTVIALPITDQHQPDDLAPRLNALQSEYAKLIEQDASNQVLGPAEDYFKLYSKTKLKKLALKPLPQTANSLDDWMIPVAKNLDFSAVKFPLVLVQEYGISAFRLAATVSLAADNLPQCQVLKQSQVTKITPVKQQWQISSEHSETQQTNPTITVDFLINACGFKTGEIDDMLTLKRQRMVEFKAAYISHWQQCQGQWPEVIFYGERGTPQGMAQLTPYPDGYFQLHGMTQNITLFKQGLVVSTDNSAQPQLAQHFVDKLNHQWQAENIYLRTQRSIDHMAQFIPNFKQAKMGGTPLFGAQQIPGDDPKLRAADVTFHGQNYARAEIVKASSALDGAQAIINKLVEYSLIPADNLTENKRFITHTLSTEQINQTASSLAKQRGYPSSLAKVLYPKP